MNLLDFTLLLVKNRWTLVRTILLGTLIVLGVSLLLPKWYQSQGTLIPVSGESGGISSLLGGYSINVFGKNVVIPESYRVILRSQSLRDSLITEFNLAEVYGSDRKEKLYRKLDRNVAVDVDKEVGIGYSPIVAIHIRVLDKEPARARDMANFCMEYLHDKSKRLNAHYVEQRHRFVEERYGQAMRELEAAEEALRQFQNEHGVVEISEQVKLIVQNLALLEAEKEKMRLELGIMATTMDAQNPAYLQMQNNLRVLQKQIADLRSGTELSQEKGQLFFPTDRIPDLAMSYYRLFRDVEVGNKIYEMLTIQYEQSRIQMNKDLPALLILDEARLPTYKHKPKRLYLVLAGFLVSAVLSVLFVSVRYYYRTESGKDSAEGRKMREMVESLKSDFRRNSE